MRNFYGVAFCLLFGGSATAQSLTVDGTIGTQVTEGTTQIVRVEQKDGLAPLALKSDTLTAAIERATNHQIYTAVDPVFNVALPVFGTNSRFFYVGQKFDLNHSAKVTGFAVSSSFVSINDASDSMFISMMEIDGSNLTPVGSPVYFTTNQLVFSQTNPLEGITVFPLPATQISKDFIFFVQTLSLGNNPDVVGIWSNTHKDGKGENRSFFLTFNQNGQPVIGNIGTVFQVSAEPMDADAYIFPIIEFEETVAGVAQYPTLSGLTLKGAYPSAATQQTAIRFALDKSSPVSIDILDLSGKIVKSFAAQQFSEGNHEMTLDLTGIASGSYLYKITTNQAQVASKLTIVR